MFLFHFLFFIEYEENKKVSKRQRFLFRCLSVILMKFSSKLHLIQMRINPAFREQFLMCAFLRNSILRQHQNPLCIPDCGQPVRNHEGCPVFRQKFQRFLDDFSLSLSSAEVASSKIRIGGFLRNTRAMESRCFWPPESFTPRWPISVS